jgi:hypothetical protein
MMKHIAVALLVLSMAGRVSAHERDILVAFDGGIGVDPVSNGAAPTNNDGTFQNVARNIVRGAKRRPHSASTAPRMWCLSIKTAIFESTMC